MVPHTVLYTKYRIILINKDDRKVKIINSNEQWKRAFTNKRYIHPPFSERIFTMWPDMKILCGMDENIAVFKYRRVCIFGND